MDQFIPDIYQKSIYSIDYKALKNSGIKCLLFDLDNTIAPINIPVPDKDLKDLFAYLETMKFKLILLSNSSKSRVLPFKEQLNVDASFRSRKPKRKKYQRILDLYHFKVHEIAAIGDELLTDIWGANRMGFTSILVNPIGNKDRMITHTCRIFEKQIWKSFEKKGLLKKGDYYA